MHSRLTTEQRHLQTLQNVERIAVRERRERLTLHLFKKTSYYKITFAFRVFLIVFTCLAFYPKFSMDDRQQKITGIQFKSSYSGGKFSSRTNSYIEIATADGLFLPVSRSNTPIDTSGSINIYRNLVFKIVGMTQKDDTYINDVSRLPGLAGLIIISMLSLMSFQKKYQSDIPRINLVVASGLLLFIWYYIEFWISF